MAKNTVKVRKYSDVVDEFVAVAAITPGHLVEITSAGKVQVHSTAGGNVTPPMFALENELEGQVITDAFAADDRVQVWTPYRGDFVYAILKDGENVAIGDKLESAGDGTLQKHVADALDESWDASSVMPSTSFDITVYPNQIVGIATEAVDMSGSSGADPSGRIIVRVI